jgi:hypothetical protein
MFGGLLRINMPNNIKAKEACKTSLQAVPEHFSRVA